MKHRTLAAWFLRCSAFLLALLAVGPAPASAATFYVNTTLDRPDYDLNDGLCISTNGNCSLRSAVEQSNRLGGSHRIVLSRASAYLLNSPLTIRATIEIDGIGIDQTRIDCQYGSSGFLVAGKLYLSDLTVQNCLRHENENLFQLSGVKFSSNGPIWNRATLQVIGSTFFGSFNPKSGGAIHNTGFTSILESVLEYNATDVDGGAIFNAGEMVMALSRFRHNSAGYKGGAIHNIGKMDIQLVTFDENWASRGAGLYAEAPGEVSIWESSFIHNRASTAGGAIYSSSVFLQLVSSTVSGNRAVEGGGIYSASEPNRLWLTNATVTNNTAALPDGPSSGMGGGLYGAASLRHTILAGNTASGRGQDCFAGATVPVSRDYNIIGILNDCGLVPAPTDETGSLRRPVNPGLLPLNETTRWPPFHEPDARSRAIDFGDPTACRRADGLKILQDQREYPRPLGAACDAGAIEVRQ